MKLNSIHVNTNTISGTVRSLRTVYSEKRINILQLCELIQFTYVLVSNKCVEKKKNTHSIPMTSNDLSRRWLYTASHGLKLYNVFVFSLLAPASFCFTLPVFAHFSFLGNLFSHTVEKFVKQPFCRFSDDRYEQNNCNHLIVTTVVKILVDYWIKSSLKFLKVFIKFPEYYWKKSRCNIRVIHKRIFNVRFLLLAEINNVSKFTYYLKLFRFKSID